MFIDSRHSCCLSELFRQQRQCDPPVNWSDSLIFGILPTKYNLKLSDFYTFLKISYITVIHLIVSII